MLKCESGTRRAGVSHDQGEARQPHDIACRHNVVVLVGMRSGSAKSRSAQTLRDFSYARRLDPWTRPALRSKKYLRIKLPSRPGNSAPQTRHVTS